MLQEIARLTLARTRSGKRQPVAIKVISLFARWSERGLSGLPSSNPPEVPPVQELSKGGRSFHRTWWYEAAWMVSLKCPPSEGWRRATAVAKSRGGLIVVSHPP